MQGFGLCTDASQVCNLSFLFTFQADTLFLLVLWIVGLARNVPMLLVLIVILYLGLCLISCSQNQQYHWLLPHQFLVGLNRTVLAQIALFCTGYLLNNLQKSVNVLFLWKSPRQRLISWLRMISMEVRKNWRLS